MNEISEQRYDYRMRYYKENHQKILDRNKAYAASHPIEIKLNKMRQVDSNPSAYRENARQYQIEHPEVHLESSRRYNEKPGVKDMQFIARESLKLVRSGVIPQSNCKCGAAWKFLYHNDYIDPKNIEFCCKECFWKLTKERYRLKKMSELTAKNNPLKS